MGSSKSPSAVKQAKATRKRKPGLNSPGAMGYESFVWIPLEMLQSDALRSLSRAGSQLFLAILREHAEHGGHENGKLMVTHEQAKALGISGSGIRPAIEELEFLGFISFVQGGRYHGSNQPNLFRIAWLWSKDRSGANVAPTDVWKTRSAAVIKAWHKERSEAKKAKRSWKRQHASEASPTVSH